MTPILSRPSFARQYSGNPSPSGSPKVSRVIEMKVNRQSGLITNELTNQQETTFNVSDGDSSSHSWKSNPPNMLPSDTPPPDTPPPDTPPPDTPPPDMHPPDALPPDVPPPDIPPTDMSPLDMPTLNMLPPDSPPPDSPPPDLPPTDMPHLDTSLYTPDMPPPSNLLFDMQPFVAKDIPPFGLDVVHLEIHKQQGKKGIGITLSGSINRQRDVYPTIKRLLHGSVGGKCGLIIGDKIGFINNNSTAGCTSQEVMNILIEAPNVFDIVVYRDPNMTSESTPSLSSVYGQSVTYTDSVSSLLSDEDSITTGIRRPSLPVQSSLTITSLQSSELTIDKNTLNNITKDNPFQYTTSSPSNNTPPQPTSPPPSPPRIDPPLRPTTPPPSPPRIDRPPQPTTPPPSPPRIDLPLRPTTPPPSPPWIDPPARPTMPSPSPPRIDPPPQPTTPQPSPPRIDPPAQPTTPPQSPPRPTTPPPSPPCKGSTRDTGPFTVQVMKGLFSLGLTVRKTEAGLFEVKAISSRSPFRKDNTLQYGILNKCHYNLLIHSIVIESMICYYLLMTMMLLD